MLLITLLTYTLSVPTLHKLISILLNTIIFSFKLLWYKSQMSSVSNYSPPSIYFHHSKYKCTTKDPVFKVHIARSLYMTDQVLHTTWTHMQLPRSRSCFLLFFGVSLRFNPVARSRNRHFSWKRYKKSIYTVPHSPLTNARYYLSKNTQDVI